MRKAVNRWGVACVLGFAVLCPGAITNVEYLLNQSDHFRDGYPYGDVTVEANSVTGEVSFTVNIYEKAYDIINLGFGIDGFGFGYQNITSLPETWTKNLPTGWSQSVDQKLDGFGYFMVSEAYGTGLRSNPLEFSVVIPQASEAVASNFLVLSTGSVQGDGGEYFVAHVAGFTMTGDATKNITEHWAGGKTFLAPEPVTALFLLAGLSLLGWFKRR